MKQELRQVAPRKWRQRSLCVLNAGGRRVSAALREVNARGAFLETNARPRIGATVSLDHPEAGTISGEVTAHAGDGVSVAFRPDARAVGFALAAIAAEMSRPAA